MHVSSEELDKLARDILGRFENTAPSPKERAQIPAQEMPAQDPAERVRNMREVALGYTPSQVRAESLRCLQCRNKPCIQGCPVSIDIPAFIAEAAKGSFDAAAKIFRKTAPFPGIVSRVCDQPCQGTCRRGEAG